ncbi:MAG: ATP-dependent Clp protease ATP-binding subunit ClpA [Spirochaetales bacterium]|nr:ATP-dependent Clp protease ATP-binding subunit ClpA [Spirochaetales bacterium]
MNVSQEVQAIFNAAYNEAKLRSHEYLTPEHILFASLSFESVRVILEGCEADIEQIRAGMESYFDQKIPAVKNQEPIQTAGFQSVIERAVLQAQAAGKDEVRVADVLVSLFDEERNYSAYYLRKSGIKRIQLLEVISHGPDGGTYAPGAQGEDGEAASGPDDADEAEAGPDELSGATAEDDEETGEERPGPKARASVRAGALERFATDLTRLAREGRLEPVIGRELEIERTVQVLCRRLKNNPIHVGEAGVGKTAVTEGLAQRIVADLVPPRLRGYTIYSLDMGSLLAGTKFRGDFEERVKRVVDELLKKDKAILFIDEIHTIVGAGAVSGGSMDASNLLKPALTSGKLRCIGSTTFEEYQKFFDKDRALSRRFQKIDIVEPTHAEAVEILKGLRTKYEEFHKVAYDDEALELAVKLSSQYVIERRLPDKAIDVIDEAGAWARMRAYKEAAKAPDEAPADGRKPAEEAVLPIGRKEIETVVARIARIPEATVTSDEREKLAGLEAELKASVFGQDAAVEAVAKAVKRARAGFRAPDKPVANFLFVGPTGVGKTELAKRLAERLGVALHRYDMSEYQEKHTVSRLIGSPPGYVGYEEGGLLTDAVRKTPHAVVLLDEIEKAHVDVYNILLQIMDYATLTDNQGRKADFRNVILIMTSNAGARDIGKPMIGFGERAFTEAAIDDAVQKAFTPEFRNRLDAVVRFANLPKDVIERIVAKSIDDFRAQLSEKKVSVEVSDEAVAYLAEKGYSREFGARNIGRLVEDKVKGWFVDEVLFGSLASGGAARVFLKDGDISIEALAAAPPSRAKRKPPRKPADAGAAESLAEGSSEGTGAAGGSVSAEGSGAGTGGS